MALRFIAPISCTSALLRRCSASGTISTTPRTGFRICPAAESGICRSSDQISSDHLEFCSSRNVRLRAEQVGVVRSQSSVTGPEVVDGEESRGANLTSRRLIFYSKPGCCLCDGLKEKLEGSEVFPDVQLEVRDITTNSDWWNAYQYQIPVLARVREDGVEIPLPRLSPRLSAEQVQKKILVLLTNVD